MPKENQRVALSKRLIKEGLIKLLNKKHIDEISVRELCEACEINRTTFYRHYQTPHDVLRETEIDFIKRIQEHPLISSAGNDVEKHAAYMCSFLFNNRELVKVFLQNSTDSDITFICRNFFDDFLSSRQILYKGRSVSPEILKLMKSFFTYGIYSIVRSWLIEDIALTPEQVAELIAGSFNRDFTFQ